MGHILRVPINIMTWFQIYSSSWLTEWDVILVLFDRLQLSSSTVRSSQGNSNPSSRWYGAEDTHAPGAKSVEHKVSPTRSDTLSGWLRHRVSALSAHAIAPWKSLLLLCNLDFLLWLLQGSWWSKPKPKRGLHLLAWSVHLNWLLPLLALEIVYVDVFNWLLWCLLFLKSLSVWLLGLTLLTLWRRFPGAAGAWASTFLGM